MKTSVRVARITRRGPASRPASCSSRANAPNRGSRSGPSGTSRLLDQGRDLLPHPLEILLVFQRRAQGRIDKIRVDARRAQGGERSRPVQRLRHPWHFVEIHRSQALDKAGHLARQAVRRLGGARTHDLDLLLEVGVVDPVVEAAALERVMHLASAVGGDDHERSTLGFDGSDFGDRDLEVGQELEQKRLELLVGPIDLVDQQHRRDWIVVVYGIEEGPSQEELGAEDLALRDAAVLPFTHQPDVQELPRIIPLVDRMRQVDAFVALEADEPRAQHVGHDLCGLRLADPGLAFDEERLFQLQGKEDRGGEAAISDVFALAQAHLDLLDGRGSAGGHARRLRGGSARVPSHLTPAYLACSIARFVSTRARCFLYSGLARRSPEGFKPSDACCAASSGLAPFFSASSTALARTGVGPTLVRPMRQSPVIFCAAAPTIAQSNRRRRNLMYLCGPFATGKTISVTISSAPSGVVNRSLKKSLAAIVRRLVTISASSIRAMAG